MNEGQYRLAKAKFKEVLALQLKAMGVKQSTTQQTLAFLVQVCEKQGQPWQSLSYCQTLYEGQCASMTASHPKVQATAKELQRLTALAGCQWMCWSLGAW